MPHDFADAMRRCSSCIRSSVRATSMPPHSVKTPELPVLAHALERERVISLEWSTGKMKFDAWPVEPPGFGSGPLSSSTRSRPAELGEVVGEAVADDAGADHDGARGRGREEVSVMALIYHASSSTARMACSKCSTWRAHQRGRALARRRRGSPRAASRCSWTASSQLARRGRARGTRCAARGCSTPRASPRGTGCGSSGR